MTRPAALQKLKKRYAAKGFKVWYDPPDPYCSILNVQSPTELFHLGMWAGESVIHLSTPRDYGAPCAEMKLDATDPDAMQAIINRIESGSESK